VVLLIGERMRHQFGGPWTVEKLDALSAYLQTNCSKTKPLKSGPFSRAEYMCEKGVSLR